MTRQTLRYYLVSFLWIVSVAGHAQDISLRLWYDRPAAQWEETLPLGNGRIGLMPDGGVVTETITLNDISLWSGGPQDANNYNASKQLPKIRSLLLQGKNDEAEALINKEFVCTGQGSGRGNGANVPFGCYQMLGELQLEFDYGKNDPQVTEYKRELSLNNAVASCSYRLGDNVYSREYFTSFSEDVGVIKLKSDKPGQLSFRLSLSRPSRVSVNTNDQSITMNGQLTNGTDGNGMQYMANVTVRLKNGVIKKSNNKELMIENADEAILIISAGTDFRNKDFVQTTLELLKKASAYSFEGLRSRHSEHYKKMFDRVSVMFSKNNRDEITTNQRLNDFQKNPDADPQLAALFYQFGRYLSISSTRVGLLPPNLQGLWANQIQTPWNGDYHLDVNVQMNHWPLEVSNLSELNLPLADLVEGMISSGERTAKAYYNAEGWVAHVITNVWGFTEPGEDASWGATNAGSGWLCNNLWEHYAFTSDKEYLKRIYPILKGSAMFYKSVLIEEPKHKWLVTAPSVSPENSFYLPNGKHASICMGPTIDNQITRELFSNVILASEILQTDEDLRKELKTKLAKLPPAGRIASDGRLMEWLEEYKETDPKHRHLSHLYGLYPASLITPEATPDLAEACRKSLEVRGDDSPGWSKAYKLLFWARLHDGNRAYKLLKELLKPTADTNINYGDGGGTYMNMLSAGPPFQIDGNFGGTAGIAEMLLQSHAGYIHLLPAIPDAWKDFGEAKGLKARGNYTVDIKWRKGVVSEYNIYSAEATTVKVNVNGEVKSVNTQVR